MGISEVNSKGGCLQLAVKHLKQLQDNTMEALAWLERGDAFAPDESKTVQELKDALAKSIEREIELETALALSRMRATKLLKVDDELDALTERHRKLENNLAAFMAKEQDLEQKLAASMARERRLTAYIGDLSKMAAEAESILEDVSNIGMILPTPPAQEGSSAHWGQVLDNSPEACCQNYEECNKQCVPLANHWRNRAREVEKQGREHRWYMQWVTPDVTCNTEPAKPQTGAQFPPWYNANSEFKA